MALSALLLTGRIAAWCIFCITNQISDGHLIKGPTDYIVFTGDSVVLFCEYDNATSLAPAWVWLNNLNKDKQPTLQTDIYNECSGETPHFLQNVEVNTSKPYHRDMLITNITTKNAGAYFCIDSCGMEDMRQAELTVILAQPNCTAIVEQDAYQKINLPIYALLDRLNDKSHYNTKFMCSFKYKGRDELIGDWITADGIVKTIHETTSWTSDRIHEMMSMVILNSSLYVSSWKLSYQIKSRNLVWSSETFLVKDISPPRDITFTPFNGVYDVNQTVKCEAKGENIIYVWIDEKQGTIIQGDTIALASNEKGMAVKFRCIALNSFGYTTQLLQFNLQENGKMRIENTINESEKFLNENPYLSRTLFLAQGLFAAILIILFITSIFIYKRVQSPTMCRKHHQSTSASNSTNSTAPLRHSVSVASVDEELKEITQTESEYRFQVTPVSTV